MFAPVTLTFTPGSAPPVASLTVPEMDPVVRCAQAGRARAARRMGSARFLIMYSSSFGYGWLAAV
jgi:hypothetical protein